MELRNKSQTNNWINWERNARFKCCWAGLQMIKIMLPRWKWMRFSCEIHKLSNNWLDTIIFGEKYLSIVGGISRHTIESEMKGNFFFIFQLYEMCVFASSWLNSKRKSIATKKKKIFVRCCSSGRRSEKSGWWLEIEWQNWIKDVENSKSFKFNSNNLHRIPWKITT